MKYIFVTLALLVLSVTRLSAGEVRGVWLTTNAGLDWPGSVYDVEAQKKSLADMLDRLRKAHFNLVVFQVQANGDVAWDSRLQPAMASLTGDGSKTPGYDVCRYVIDECHRRGMECHAWVVPFRLGTAKNASQYSSGKVKHPVRSHPELCVRYKGASYLDPGNPATRAYLVALYRELVERYDFDGINLDYTRYPGVDFPDGASFRKYNPGRLGRDDWRRDNINRFVVELYDMVKSVRPEMTVGSAPIGTYKNVKHYKNSTAYDTYHQDPVAWIAGGHHDMIIPQMYWTEKFGFSDHIGTWVAGAGGHPVIVGLAPYKIVESGWTADDVIGLMKKASSCDGVGGVCFFRAAHVLGNQPEVKKLYRYLVKHKPAASKRRHADKAESVEKFLE